MQWVAIGDWIVEIIKLLGLGSLLGVVIGALASYKIQQKFLNQQIRREIGREMSDISVALNDQEARLLGIIARATGLFSKHQQLPPNLQSIFDTKVEMLGELAQSLTTLLEDVSPLLERVDNFSHESTSMDDAYRLKAEVNGRLMHIERLEEIMNAHISEIQNDIIKVQQQRN